MSNANAGSNMNPMNDSFSFNSMASAGVYVYIPMIIMGVLLATTIYNYKEIPLPKVSIPLYSLLGFFVGNVAYHNLNAWGNVDGKVIKMSGLLGYIGGIIGAGLGYWFVRGK